MKLNFLCWRTLLHTQPKIFPRSADGSIEQHLVMFGIQSVNHLRESSFAFVYRTQSIVGVVVKHQP